MPEDVSSSSAADLPEDEARQEEEAARHPLPLPTHGDSLFKTQSDPELAWIEQTFSPQKTYLTGYQWAADYLFQKARESTSEAAQAATEAREGKGNWPEVLPMSVEPWLVYPIYFLYRHAIELALKDILRVQDHEGWLDQKGKKLIDECHNVLKLWETVKPWMTTFCHRTLGREMPAFEAMLSEIEQYDPNAQAGRYHLLKRKGQKIPVGSFRGITPLDLAHFQCNATKLLNFVTWVWTLYEQKVQDEENERWWRGNEG